MDRSGYLPEREELTGIVEVTVRDQRRATVPIMGACSAPNCCRVCEKDQSPRGAGALAVPEGRVDKRSRRSLESLVRRLGQRLVGEHDEPSQEGLGYGVRQVA